MLDSARHGRSTAGDAATDGAGRGGHRGPVVAAWERSGEQHGIVLHVLAPAADREIEHVPGGG